MDTDTTSQEGREDLPSELSFALAPRETDPAPIVTRSREVSRAESTSVMATRSRARKGRGVSVISEAPREPEIEMRPEPEIPVSQASALTCDGGLGGAKPSAIETTSLFTSAEKPEMVAAHTGLV